MVEAWSASVVAVPMPVGAANATRSPSRDWVSFDVDSTVDDVLLAMENAIDPSSLFYMLRGPVVELIQDRIDSRFAAEGDAASGKWADLAESTNEIRKALGYPPAHPINQRTKEMRKFLTTHADVSVDTFGATAQIPGDISDPVMVRKVQTAQEGSNSNPFKGAGPTPARPVLAVDLIDVGIVLGVMQEEILTNFFAGMDVA